MMFVPFGIEIPMYIDATAHGTWSFVRVHGSRICVRHGPTTTRNSQKMSAITHLANTKFVLRKTPTLGYYDIYKATVIYRHHSSFHRSLAKVFRLVIYSASLPTLPTPSTTTFVDCNLFHLTHLLRRRYVSPYCNTLVDCCLFSVSKLATLPPTNAT